MSPKPLLAAAVLMMVMHIAALVGCHKPPATSPVGDDLSAERDKPAGPQYSRAATLARIRRLIAVGSVSEAQPLLRTHLVRYPDDAEGIALAAQLAAMRGQVDEAVNMLDSAASLTDQGKPLQAQASDLLASAGRWQEAIARLEALVDEHPDDDESRHRLVKFLNARGFRFDANEHVRALCLRNQATMDELRGLMVPTRSHGGFTEKPDIHHPEVIVKYGALNIARGLFSEGDVREAAEVLKQSRLVQDNHPAAVAFYGQVLLESQQFDDFEKWLRDVEPECQRYPAYWMAIGGWALRGRKHESAIRMFAEAIVREPGDLKANDRITQALAAAGHMDASERFRDRGVEIDRLILQTKDFLKDPEENFASISDIATGLNLIGRPLESLAWSRVALLRMGSPRAAMNQLAVGAANLADAEFQSSVKRNLLCGIDLSDFPLDMAAVESGSQRPTPVPLGRERPRSYQPLFANIAPQTGLDFRYRNAPIPVEREMLIFQQIGAGVACFDYDLDSRVDFYIGQGSGDPSQNSGTRPNMLARNLDGRFQNVTELADCDDRGFTGGVTAGDWNQDGFADLVVANLQRNTLFINQGDGTFRIQSGDPAWNDSMYTASVAMGDVDGDHLPDIVEVNYIDDPHIFDPIERHPDGTPISLPAPNSFQAAVDRVFLSRGDGSYSGQLLDGSDQPVNGTGLGVVVTDFNGDGRNEIFVANDHTPNHYWERPNDSAEGMRWHNTAAVRGVAYGTSGEPLGCMGVAVADFNEDGHLDLHVTNFENQWSNLFMQVNGGYFDDLVIAYGLGKPTFEMLGFGTQSIDYDNNSIIDLVVGNGHVEDLRVFEMPTQMFTLEGSRFEPVDVGGDSDYWGSGHLTRALAVCDWNRDGRIDIVTTDLKQPFALLENRTETPFHWLQLQLVGTLAERDAIGATIKATYGSRTITKVIQSGDGYMCKNESLVCFGLGESDRVERLEIHWPNGDLKTITDVVADQRWLIIQNEDDAFRLDSH